jgi:hypothetical protein
MLNVTYKHIMLTVIKLSVIMVSVIKLSVIMPSVILLNVIMLSVIMLSVVAPFCTVSLSLSMVEPFSQHLGVFSCQPNHGYHR